MVAEAVVDSEALISSIADEKAQQLGFRYWAYSAWTGTPRERVFSVHNVPADLWRAYLGMLGSATHQRPMLWHMNQRAGTGLPDPLPNDPVLDLLRRHDIGCGLQLPLYGPGGLVATLVLAACGLLGNRPCRSMFQQGQGMLCELHQLCLPRLRGLHGAVDGSRVRAAAASFA